MKYFFFKIILLLKVSLLINLNLPINSAYSADNSEYLIFNIYEHKFKKSKVPVLLALPKNSFKKPYPLIIIQHGSEPKIKFPKGDGKTDVYSYRLFNKGLNNGFAVAIIDAFYKKNLIPTDKTRFPFARMYAEEVKNKLAVREDIDGNRLFYTGFSYGGNQTLHSLLNKQSMYKPSWKALAAAEPGCNAFPEPRWVTSPILILKGNESHYKPKPCETFKTLFNEKGSKVELKIFEKSNHHFSYNGTFTKGIAFNGCEKNPIILKLNGKHIFLDGTSAQDEKTRWQKCFTTNGGSGKTYEEMDRAVTEVINFFSKQ